MTGKIISLLLSISITSAFAGVMESVLPEEKTVVGNQIEIQFVGKANKICSSEDVAFIRAVESIIDEARLGNLPRLKTMLSDAHPLVVKARVRDGITVRYQNEEWLLPIKGSEWMYVVTNSNAFGYQVIESVEYLQYCQQ